MLPRKSNPVTSYRRSTENLLSPDSPISPTSWEKHYNVRQGSSTLIFSSEELPSSGDPALPAAPAPAPASFISEVTIQTGINRPEAESTEAAQPSYRSVMAGRAGSAGSSERFTYLRKLGDHQQLHPRMQYNKMSDPGPKSIASIAIHQRSHSDEIHPSHCGSISSSSLPAAARPSQLAVNTPPESTPSGLPEQRPPAKLPTLTRPKRPEELECDQLSKDLINHLPPSDKLHALLSVPDPSHATACLVEGLFEMQLSETTAVPATTTTSSTTSPSSSSASSVTSAGGHASPPPPVLSSPKSNSCTPLPATSAYFTTSEPRAKLLNRYAHNIHNGNDGHVDQQPVSSELLVKKKEELVCRLARKLDVLRCEREAIQEEVEANEVLGAAVAARVSSVATPTESNKVSLHVAEVDKITALLLALAGRLARAQNALLSLRPLTDAAEKNVLEGKRDKLMEQLEEAKRLKENIDRRSRQVANLLTKYLSDDEFADYSHFVTMKAKLVIDQREIDDKIKLGEEQLAALRETLHLRPRTLH